MDMPPPPTPREYVAQRIQAAMDEQGVSQRYLAEVAGIPTANLSRYLRAKTSARLDDLASIAQALGVPLADLMPASAA